jgi:hypothetical protein
VNREWLPLPFLIRTLSGAFGTRLDEAVVPVTGILTVGSYGATPTLRACGGCWLGLVYRIYVVVT